MMNKNVSVKDFDTVSVIGKGTYAKVLLVRSRDDHQLYALKSLKKKFILEKNQERHIMTEKEILAGIAHPFLVKMKLSFQDEHKLYFLLEYCPGGELFTLLSARDTITEEQYTQSNSELSSTLPKSCLRWTLSTRRR